MCDDGTLICRLPRQRAAMRSVLYIATARQPEEVCLQRDRPAKNMPSSQFYRLYARSERVSSIFAVQEAHDASVALIDHRAGAAAVISKNTGTPTRTQKERRLYSLMSPCRSQNTQQLIKHLLIYTDAMKRASLCQTFSAESEASRTFEPRSEPSFVLLSCGGALGYGMKPSVRNSSPPLPASR